MTKRERLYVFLATAGAVLVALLGYALVWLIVNFHMLVLEALLLWLALFFARCIWVELQRNGKVSRG